jgi:hypothetical protein
LLTAGAVIITAAPKLTSLNLPQLTSIAMDLLVKDCAVTVLALVGAAALFLHRRQDRSAQSR